MKKPCIRTGSRLHSRVYFCREAVCFQVQGGLGRLCCQAPPWPENPTQRRELYQVLLDERLLLRLHVDDCPSYAGWMLRGYGDGIAPACPELSERAGAPWQGLAEALGRFAPLLGLLESGPYLAMDCDLFPTLGWTGVRNHFWEDPGALGTLEELQFYGWLLGNRYFWSIPLFLFPSQRLTLLQPERVAYWRERLETEGDAFPRAIALCLNGACTLLLDGHHRAAAAALAGRPVRTVVIGYLESAVGAVGGQRLLLRQFHGEPMAVCTAAGQKLSRVRSLQDRPPGPLSGTLPWQNDETDFPPWGALPEEYRAGLDACPQSSTLMYGTALPPDELRSAWGALQNWFSRADTCDHTAMGQFTGLFSFGRLFPDSKWLTGEERSRLERTAERLGISEPAECRMYL